MAAPNGALVNPQSGKCLDVAGGGTADGTQVRLWSCNGTGAQQWQFNGNGTVTNPGSGQVPRRGGPGHGQRHADPDLGLLRRRRTQSNQVWSLR